MQYKKAVPLPQSTVDTSLIFVAIPAVVPHALLSMTQLWIKETVNYFLTYASYINYFTYILSANRDNEPQR